MQRVCFSRTKRGVLSTKSTLGAIDERAIATRNAIARAMVTLGKAQPVDSITIGKLARQAGIARSTFYTHYASRSAYLETAYANMMASSALKAATLPEGQGQVLATSLILDHLHQSRAFAVSVEQSRDRPRMLAAGELRLRTIAEDNLASLLPDIDPRHRRAAATFIVGGFMGLLRQWTATGLQEPPAAIRHRFETMARSVVEGLKR